MVCALTLLATGVRPAAEAGPRAGRVVRIERPRVGLKRRIRLCIQAAPQAKMICLGSPPLAPGELFHMLDFQDGYVDEARVRTSQPSPVDKCETGDITEITYEMTGTSNAGLSHLLVGISGIDIDPRVGRVLLNLDPPPGAAKGEQTWIGIDATGADGPELMITSRECNDKNPPPRARNRPSQGQCISFWERDGADWHVTNQETVWSCD